MPFKTRSLLALLALTAFPLVGCESWSDNPHNEDRATQSDIQKSGPGSYGGTSSTADSGNSVGHSSPTAGTTAPPGLGSGTPTGRAANPSSP